MYKVILNTGTRFLGFKQDTNLALDKLNQLPYLLKGWILHSDQGSVYTSCADQKAVKEKGITTCT